MKIYLAGNTALREREKILLDNGTNHRLNSYWFLEDFWKKFIDLYRDYKDK